MNTTSLPYSQISIYSVITGNTLLETERQNMVSDQEANNTSFYIPMATFSAAKINRQGQLLMVEVSEDHRGHLGTVIRFDIKE